MTLQIMNIIKKNFKDCSIVDKLIPFPNTAI
jgi:hypothetical protein